MHRRKPKVHNIGEGDLFPRIFYVVLGNQIESKFKFSNFLPRKQAFLTTPKTSS